jgi:hypothetical protein
MIPNSPFLLLLVTVYLCCPPPNSIPHTFYACRCPEKNTILGVRRMVEEVATALLDASRRMSMTSSTDRDVISMTSMKQTFCAVLVAGAFLTPGSGMGKKSGSGSGLKNPDHISESLETNFLGLNYFNSLMRIRDPGWKKMWVRDPGWKKFGSEINIPAPQHC